MCAERMASGFAPGLGGKICWCRRADSNRQPIAYEAIALPLSYCGVQKEPCSKLLSNKPPPRTRCVPLPLVGLCTINRFCTKSQEAAQKPKNRGGLFTSPVSRIINRYG